ncbi:MAG: GNAT family N-acetyltransferase [Candidatus Firestonebacteria bacterium]|nr:GNAT family N-acetyltransferase [Candidatus Firestonebacteria bacterium]
MTPDTDFEITPLSANSLAEMIRLTRLYFQEQDLVPEFHALDQDLTQPLIVYAPPRGNFWLVRASGQEERAVGMLGVMPLAKRTCEIKRLYLASEYRGKKWGGKLLEHALAFARRAEYLEVLVSLQHEQKAALNLFAHQGFKPCARFSEHQHAGIFLTLKLNT